METKRSAIQTETQPADSIEHSPTESRRGRRHSEETKAKISEANKGKKLSEETRAKIGEASRGRKPSAETRAKMSKTKSGENHPMYGKKHTEEARAKMSAANSGENHPMYGKKLSEETRAKLSEANKGKKCSAETRAKMSAAQKGENNPNYGKKLSAETRAKMSAAKSGENHPMYGKKHTEETRAKISAANSGENSHSWDKNIEQVRQAIVLHAGGMTMKQASLRMGFNEGWLSGWKRNHPERFREFYFEEIEKNDRKMIRRAVGAYALGASMEEASRHVGMPEKWFRSWQDENLEKFEILLKHINDKETRLVRQIFRLCSDEDMSMEEATSELGLESDWLKGWRENNPVRYGRIKEEERLIFGDRLNSLLIRLERQM